MARLLQAGAKGKLGGAGAAIGVTAARASPARRTAPAPLAREFDRGASRSLFCRRKVFATVWSANGSDQVHIVERIWYFLSASYREHLRERPEVLLVLGRRRPDSDWRLARFSIRNLINQQLVVTEIALRGSSGCRISAAVGEFENWRVDDKRGGRTLRLSQIIRPSTRQSLRQDVAFFVRHPRDSDGARHYVKVTILLEHRMDRSRRWRVTLEGQLPQAPTDPRLYGPFGVHTGNWSVVGGHAQVEHVDPI